MKALDRLDFAGLLQKRGNRLIDYIIIKIVIMKNVYYYVGLLYIF